MKKLLLIAVVIMGLVMMNPGNAMAEDVVELTYWHAMSGITQDHIEDQVERFNELYDDIEVSVEYQGSYRDVLDTTQAALRAGNPPHVIQSFEISTRQLIDMGAFIPLEETLEGVDWDQYLDPVTQYYNVEDVLYSMPYNSSNPILYYNKDLFEEAGLDPEQPPETFQELTEYSEQIVESGAAEHGWVMPLHSWFFEQWMANMGSVFANNENGRLERPTSLDLDQAAEDILGWWDAEYQADNYVNPGVEAWGESRSIFAGQRAAIAIDSTAAIAPKTASAEEQGFELGTGYLPIHEDYDRHGTTIGGGSLWVIDGHTPEETEAAGEFVRFLSSPEEQVDWHKTTGYFPVHEEAVEMLEEEGYYEDNPNHATAINQLRETENIPATQGAMIGPFPEIRTQITDAAQYVFGGEKSVAEALQDAEAESETIMERYRRVVVD